MTVKLRVSVDTYPLLRETLSTVEHSVDYSLAVGLKLSKFAAISTRGVKEQLVLHPPADELGRAGQGATLQLSQLTMAIGCCVSDPKGGIGNPGSANPIETGLAAGQALAAELNSISGPTPQAYIRTAVSLCASMEISRHGRRSAQGLSVA
ncbi:hypothetical protein TGAM01_v200559 [Trichoderma gamsii]|uniref:Uncharacterized protein n=1 Tax=Trichoderma gamsii TaxID=398673 RepID=A0A2P5A0P2_9HYPO|nr:hypothetical protein TGAM01_v200559 [Trichoderma gamsii]PON30119.1 hypothetical protein TGAM01_v200559 [Trichoderma gamsii]